MASSSSRLNGLPHSSLPAMIPATTAAELLPSPLPTGILFWHTIPTWATGFPVLAKGTEKASMMKLPCPAGRSSEP